MKRTISIFLAVMLLTFALSLPAVASVSNDSIGIGDDNSINASHQIASYSIGIVPRGGGRVEVTANIVGTHRQMTRIGFPSIILYERPNSSSSWIGVSSHSGIYNPNVPAGSHTFTFTYQGVIGRQYYARAQFFAQDAQGSDSRSANSPTITAT
jgi:hypothetical protein